MTDLTLEILDGYHDEAFVTVKDLRRVLRPIHDELRNLNMADEALVAAQAEEATELATVTTDLATLATDTTDALAALQKKVEEGGTVTAAELETAVNNSKSVASGLATVDASIKAQDATVNPPAPTPSPEPTPTPVETPTNETPPAETPPAGS